MNDALMIMNRCHNDDSICPMVGGANACAETWSGKTPLPILNARLHSLILSPGELEGSGDLISTILQYYFVSQAKNDGSMKNFQTP